jgi:hypothetical protein
VKKEKEKTEKIRGNKKDKIKKGLKEIHWDVVMNFSFPNTAFASISKCHFLKAAIIVGR